MTTTAEKIKVMQAFEDGAQIEFISNRTGGWCCVGSTELQWNWERCAYRIKLSDPEPLEGWITLNEKGQITSASKHVPHPVGNATMIPVREITPQDEQDRKDAMRYRKAKEVSRNTTGLPTLIVSQWDDFLDNAIEDQT